MSCCCSEFVTIGCFSFCDEISLGYDATETGVHSVEVYVGNGAVRTFNQTYTSGSDMTIGANRLNESRPHDIRIKMPSGDYYEFTTGVDCARVTTTVHYPLVT